MELRHWTKTKCRNFFHHLRPSSAMQRLTSVTPPLALHRSTQTKEEEDKTTQDSDETLAELEDLLMAKVKKLKADVKKLQMEVETMVNDATLNKLVTAYPQMCQHEDYLTKLLVVGMAALMIFAACIVLLRSR